MYFYIFYILYSIFYIEGRGTGGRGAGRGGRGAAASKQKKSMASDEDSPSEIVAIDSDEESVPRAASKSSRTSSRAKTTKSYTNDEDDDSEVEVIDDVSDGSDDYVVPKGNSSAAAKGKTAAPSAAKSMAAPVVLSRPSAGAQYNFPSQLLPSQMSSQQSLFAPSGTSVAASASASVSQASTTSGRRLPSSFASLPAAKGAGNSYIDTFVLFNYHLLNVFNFVIVLFLLYYRYYFA
jgi:hypothetical protein